MRSIATALEAYCVDENAYPPCNTSNKSMRRSSEPSTALILERISTPVAYLTSSILDDPFRMRSKSGTVDSQTGSYTPVEEDGEDLKDEAPYKYCSLIQSTGTETTPLALATGDKPAKSIWMLWSVGPALIKVSLAGTLPSGSTGLLSPNATLLAASNNVYDATNGTVSRGQVFRVGGVNPGLGIAGGALCTVVQNSH
jgi:hypothetical protein